MIRNLIIRLFWLGVVLAVFGIATAYWFYHKNLEETLSFPQKTFEISSGESLSSIATRLVKMGVTKEPWTLKLLARQKENSVVQVGEYQFPEDITLTGFYDHITQGKGQVDMRITIIEGWTFKQMREALQNADKLKVITTDWSGQKIMAALGYPDLHPEGQFYPDTYYYRANETDLALFERSFKLMQTKLQQAWEQRNDDTVLKTPYQALIMASIIEKESQVWDEQPEISGVFNNRLIKGMRLQTDPTVIYGIGDEYDGNITRKHLKTDTPYNTYTRSGLTPTPISLPGNEALLAAVQPLKTKAYYFVAKGSGRHYFSKTLAEHNRAVRKYILGKK